MPQNDPSSLPHELFKQAATFQPPQTGPEAIEYALQNIDIDAVEAKAKEDLRSGKKTKRPGAVALLNIVQGMRRNNQTPADYMIRSVPVIPAKFRPFAAQGGTLIPGDANVLYKDLFDVRDAHEEERQVFGDKNAGQSRLALYDAVKSVYGYGEPVKPKTRAKEVKGFLQKLTGSTAKYCYDDETQILTRHHGWIPFADLNEDTGAVATINPDTCEFEWQTPTHFVHAPHKGGEMVHLHGTSTDLLVTRNHRVYVVEQEGEGIETHQSMRGRIVEAGELIDTQTPIQLPLTASEWEIGSTSLPQFLPEATRMALPALCGAYLALGSLKERKLVLGHAEALHEGSRSIFVFQLDCAGYNAAYDSVAGTITIPADTDLSAWFQFYMGKGEEEDDRRISTAIVNWSREHLIQFLTKYLDCMYDLHGDTTPMVLHALSTEIKDALMEMGVKAGISMTDTESDGFVVNYSAVDDSVHATIIPEYNGHVHCCSVLNGLLVVRRHGKPSISGNSYFQRRLIGKTQDNTGRSTIIVDPELSMDEVGVPRDMALTMYAPYIQRRLKRAGMKDADALKAVREKTPEALQALENEIKERPILYSRAPAWHMHSILSGRVKTIDGDAIAISPAVTAGISGDFDGDMVNAFVYIQLPESDLQDDLLQYKIAAPEEEEEVIEKLTTSGEETSISPGNVVLGLDLSIFPHGEHTNDVEGRNGPIHFYEALPGTSVLAFDPLENKLAWKPVSHWSEHPDREVEIVHLTSKDTLITDDDPRAVYGIAPGEGTLIPSRFTPTEALNKQVMVPYVSRKAHGKLLSSLPEALISHPACTAMETGEEDEVTRSFYTYTLQECREIAISYRTKGYHSAIRYDKEHAMWEVTPSCNTHEIEEDLIVTPHHIVSTLRNSLPGNPPESSVAQAVDSELENALQAGYLPRWSVQGIIDWMVREYRTTWNEDIKRALSDPEVDTWREHVVANLDISWAQVVHVEKTGKKETGYDLTVPGYETFLSVEGVVLSNTINVHVPASDAAVKEAYEKLLPSTTPFSNREEGKIVPLPKQEQILGLYTAATAPPTKEYTFTSEREAIDAIRRGQVPLSADVKITGDEAKQAATVTPPATPLPEEAEGELKPGYETATPEKGPVRDPRTGKWLPTKHDKPNPKRQ